MRKFKEEAQHDDKANARDRKRDRSGWKAARQAERRNKGKRKNFERDA